MIYFSSYLELMALMHFPCRRSVASFLAALLVMLVCGHFPSQAAAPPEVWNLSPLSASDLPARITAVERASAGLPAAVRPAVDFQKILVRITAAAALAEWRPEVEKYSKAASGESVTKALRELALCWEARGRMEEIDAALRGYYRRAVRFPESLEAVRTAIPADARTDPWGEAWVYKLAAPVGFSKETDQRYQVGPTRYPHLSTAQDFARNPPRAPDWKITPRNVGGAAALEVRIGGGQVAVVQAGSAAGGSAILAFIGDGWALFADTDRLFALPF